MLVNKNEVHEKYEPKKIGLVLDSGKIGGIESHVVELSIYLMRRNYEVVVIFLNDYSSQAIPHRLNKAGIKNYHLDGTIASFIKLIKQEKPDILHAHGYKPGVVCKLLRHFVSCHVVCTHHPGSRGQGRIYFYNWLDESLAFLANFSIAVNKTIHSRLLTKRSCVIPNFIRTIPYDSDHNPLKFNIAFVGRFHPEKGPDLFCQLSKYILPTIKCHMFGGGSMLASLKSEYQDQIFFHGEVEEIANELLNMDLLCITSRSEGLPLIALEAMGLGIPVVSFAVGGLCELIQSSYNGYLIPPDQLGPFAKTINEYYQIPIEQRLSIRRAAYQTIHDKYSDQILGPKIEAIYDEVTLSNPLR